MAMIEFSEEQKALIEAAKKKRQEAGNSPPKQYGGCVLLVTALVVGILILLTVGGSDSERKPSAPTPVSTPAPQTVDPAFMAYLELQMKEGREHFSRAIHGPFPPRPSISTPRARSSKKVPNTGKAGALGHCRTSVKEELKAPRTAKFKGMFDDPIRDVTDLGSGRFRVKSWVDSQNSFGAMIRNQFECTVDFDQGTVRVDFE